MMGIFRVGQIECEQHLLRLLVLLVTDIYFICSLGDFGFAIVDS